MRLVSAADFERLDTAFRRVVNAPPQERAEALDESCGDDADLRSEVERLLAIDGELPGFARDDRIDDALARRAASLLNHAPAHAHPVRIGQYDIVGALGSGGMGTVYRARQAHPKREVALKLMRHGAMTPKLMRRFEFEADVLARLQHPGIAQIHEAGTWDDGGGARPWFAMELVEGRPLTTFAKEAGLDQAEGLALFVQVCRAVEHAHQKGVVHRDLKPDNILVTARPDQHSHECPLVKVLDFGIARATDADVQATMSTAAGDLLGTLPYMSPEQVAGNANDVDTRCDVYALGVVLFELLAGTMPLDVQGKSIAEAARMIAQDDPRPLRGVDARFAGDLDTIVAKAMAKAREERYASAGALADDIVRHLHDEPIAARAPTAWEQCRRFARRNRAFAASLLLALTSLIAATGFSTWMAWREHQASVRAQNHLANALHQAGRAGRARSRLVDTVASLENDRGNVMAVLEERVLNARLRADEQPRQLGGILLQYSEALEARGEYTLAEAAASEAVDLFRALKAPRLPGALGQLASTLQKQGRLDEAIAVIDQACNADGQAGVESWDRAQLMCVKSRLLADGGRLVDARASAQQAVTLMRQAVPPAHPRLSRPLLAVADVEMRAGRPDSAVDAMHEALGLTYGADDASVAERMRVEDTLARALIDSGQVNKAAEHLERIIAARSEALGADDPRTARAMSMLNALE